MTHPPYYEPFIYILHSHNSGQKYILFDSPPNFFRPHKLFSIPERYIKSFQLTLTLTLTLTTDTGFDENDNENENIERFLLTKTITKTKISKDF
jgi:hypothetical protein